MNTTPAPRLNPVGEGVFESPTAGGKVRLQSTADVLTPYGGLVPWAAFARHTGIFERLAETCPVRRTSPNATPVYDVVQSFALTALIDGRRFAHVQRLREDPSVTELFGMKSVVSTTRCDASSPRSPSRPPPSGAPTPRNRCGGRCPSG